MQNERCIGRSQSIAALRKFSNFTSLMNPSQPRLSLPLHRHEQRQHGAFWGSIHYTCCVSNFNDCCSFYLPLKPRVWCLISHNSFWNTILQLTFNSRCANSVNLSLGFFRSSISMSESTLLSSQSLSIGTSRHSLEHFSNVRHPSRPARGWKRMETTKAFCRKILQSYEFSTTVHKGSSKAWYQITEISLRDNLPLLPTKYQLRRESPAQSLDCCSTSRAGSPSWGK